MSLLLLLKGAGGGGAPQSAGYPDVVLQWAPDAGPSTPLASTSWVNIPLSDVREISTNRGRSVETDDFQAGTMTVTLANALRTYDPDYTAGVYYGKLLPNRRIRLLANYAGITYPLFNGFTGDEYPQEYDPPNDAHTTISCTDGFGILQQVDAPGSVLLYEQSVDTPKLQLSLADGSIPVTAADSSGNGYDGQYVGVVASGSALAYGGDSATTFQPGATVELPYACLLQDFTVLAVDGGIAVEGMFNSSSGGSAGVGLVYYQQDTAATFGITFGAVGSNFRLSYNTGSGSTFIDTTGVNPYDGVTHHVLGTIGYIGGVSTLTLYYDGVAFTSTSSGGALSSSIPGGADILGGRTHFAYTFTGTLDEIATYQTSLTPTRAAAHYAAATAPWDGDTTGTRIGRLLDVAGWSTADRTVATGNSVLGSQAFSGATVLALIKEIEASEQGRFFISADGLATFQDRYVSIGGATSNATSTTSQATFGDDDGSHLPYFAQGFRLRKAPIRNTVTGARAGGPTITLKDAASVAAYGKRPWSMGTLQNVNDAEIRDALGHQLARYAEPVTQCDSITVKPRTSPPGQSTIGSDAFTRADSSTTLGTADTGGAWSALVGTWGIASNTAQLVSGSTGLAVLPLAADGTIQVTLTTVQDTAGIAFRCVDSSNFWIFRAVTGFTTYGLYKIVAGVETAVSLGGGNPTNGDVLTVVTSGTSIVCKVNGVSAVSTTSSELQAAHLTGIGARGAATTARWDTFSFVGAWSTAELWDAVLGMEISKRYTLTRRAQNLGNAIDFDVLLEGVAHHLTPMTWDCTPFFSAADASVNWFVLDTSMLDSGVLCF